MGREKVKWLAEGIRRFPLRKTLALALVAIALPMIIVSFCIDRDIPSNTATLLTALCTGCVVGYFATSSYEARRNDHE